MKERIIFKGLKGLIYSYKIFDFKNKMREIVFGHGNRVAVLNRRGLENEQGQMLNYLFGTIIGTGSEEEPVYHILLDTFAYERHYVEYKKLLVVQEGEGELSYFYDKPRIRELDENS